MNAPRLSIACPSSQAVGGVQTWIGYLVPGLERAGWSVTMHLPQGRFSDASGFARVHGLDGRWVSFENPTGSREGRIRALTTSLQQAKPDLVLGVNLVDTYDAVGRLRRTGFPVRLAIALHGLHACFYEDLGRWASLVEGVISPSRLGVRATSCLAGIPVERTFYAPCGIDVAPLPAELNGPGEVLRLVYVGRFDQVEKRVWDLPRILEELDRMGVPFELLLAGSGPDELALRESLAPFGMRVRFAGWLPPEQLRQEAYRPGSILLITSPSETGPIAAWDAMASGVVVVTSEFLGLRSEGALVPGSSCLAFPVGDARTAAERIATLRDQVTYRRLAIAGWHTVAARYTRQASIDAWAQSLAAILALPMSAYTRIEKNEIPPSGRLDRWLGVQRADTVRRWLGLSHMHACAGAEWPHTYASLVTDAKLNSSLAELDADLKI